MPEPRIHPTAVISSQAELDSSVTVGPFTIIESNVQIARGTKIASHALIAAGARIAEDVHISQGAVLATPPQDLKFEGEESLLNVGPRTVIREYATLNRGTKWSGRTSVGADCFLMAYSHVAHDCTIGNHVVMANSVNMGGHVVIDDWAIIGGVVAIHQFVHIGCHSMIGGGFRAVQDVCPYSLVGGYPLKVTGLNLVGLKRRGFALSQLEPLKATFKLLFSSGLNTSQALERIKSEVEQTEEVRRVVEFVATSERGIVK